MRALVVTPGHPHSARLEEVPEPPLGDGPVLVGACAVGVCGTDREIIGGAHGSPPPGETDLILGHESLGQVLEAPVSSGLSAGDWVVGIVRHPDPVPCASCAVGDWDMCRNGRYTEHGIKERHGFAAERYRLQPGRAVKLDPSLTDVGVLLEPASIVAKAWDHIGKIGERSRWTPHRVLVTGAGSIGMLAALFAAQRGLEVHIFDRAHSAPKAALAAALPATYCTGSIGDACRDVDIVVECTGASEVILGAIAACRANAVICLLGISPGGHHVPVDVGALNRQLVLENDVIFGSVNANRMHYDKAAAVLAAVDRSWLAGLITRIEPFERWADAIERRPGEIKNIIRFGTPVT